jgi:pimeloyl-ACP methyl ester carboxylesterase
MAHHLRRFMIQPTIVLVHGAWHGSWCWQRVVPLIERKGFAAMAVQLPSIGADPASGANLSGDASAVKAAIARAEGPIVLCGHSYGGMVISLAAADEPRVAHLVYLCAFVPDSGQSLIDAGGGKPSPWIQSDEQGNTWPDPAQTENLFFNDCDPATRQWARQQIARQPLGPYVEPVPNPAWRKIPSTYVVCTLDQALPAQLQRDVMAKRTTHVVELNAGHSPFLSQPGAVADVLTARAASL